MPTQVNIINNASSAGLITAVNAFLATTTTVISVQYSRTVIAAPAGVPTYDYMCFIVYT